MGGTGLKSYVIGATCALAALAAFSAPAAAQTAPKSALQVFTLKGQRPFVVEDEWAGAEIALSAADTGGRYTLLNSIWKPGFVVPPHYHKQHAETFRIVDGEVEWTVGGETHLMRAGDTVFIPPYTLHSVKVVGTKPVKMLMLYDPGGYEDHLERLGQYTKEQKEQPEIKAQLNRWGDFNEPPKGSAPPPPPPEPRSKHKFTLEGQGPMIREGLASAEVDLSAIDTQGRYTMLDENWQPGYSAPRHYHKKHAEAFHVLDGQVEWTVGGETHLMSAGDTVFIPPNTIHGVKVVGTGNARLVMLYEPGGYEEASARRQSYSAEQQKDPKIRAQLMQEGDFNLPPQ